MVPTDPSKPYLGIVGDSATHWFHGDCLGESYPALIAKHFPNYNVVDLSIVGSGNDSAFFRLHKFEKQYNIKFTKIIYQLTHFYRELIFIDYNKDEFIWNNISNKENYYYTQGKWEKHANFEVQQNKMDRQFSGGDGVSRSSLAEYFDVKSTELYKYYVNRMSSNLPIWLCEKEIDHINSHYGIDNVLIFAWYSKIDLVSTSKNFFAYIWETTLGKALGDKSNKESDLEIDLPKNYIGSIEDKLGSKVFWKIGVDDAPHYAGEGHSKVFDVLKQDVVKLMEGL